MGVPSIDSNAGKIASTAGAVGSSSLVGLPTAVLAYSDAINKAASETGVPARLIGSVVTAESCGRADIVSGAKCSSAGAIGAMQLMPATARQLGVDPTKPEQNIMGGARYLAMLIKRYGGDTATTPEAKRAVMERAVRAYNAGPGNEDKGRAAGFSETSKYQTKVMGLFAGGSTAAYASTNLASVKTPELKHGAGAWSLKDFFSFQFLFAFADTATIDQVMDRMETTDPLLFPETPADRIEFRRILAEQLRAENQDQMVNGTTFKAGAQVRMPPVELPPKPDSQFRAYTAAPVALTASATVNTAQAKPDPALGRVFLPIPSA